jgi:hypothetical protein
MNNRKFVGNLKRTQEWAFTFSFELAELPAPCEDGRVRLSLLKSKTKDAWYAVENTFKPDPSRRNNQTHAAPPEVGPSESFPEDDLPF